jgi:hypothetical protein
VTPDDTAAASAPESLAPLGDVETADPPAPAPESTPAPVVERAPVLAVPPEKKLILPKPAPPLVRVRERKDPTQLEIKTDRDGNGSGFYGQDIDLIRAVTCRDATARVSMEESHSITITRVNVKNAAVKDGTVLVRVVLK